MVSSFCIYQNIYSKIQIISLMSYKYIFRPIRDFILIDNKLSTNILSLRDGSVRN
jgi:hypothetical protein